MSQTRNAISKTYNLSVKNFLSFLTFNTLSRELYSRPVDSTIYLPALALQKYGSVKKPSDIDGRLS